MNANRKKRIGIIFGGRSREHEVSVSSVKSILKFIDSSRYEIQLIGITHQGEWVAGDDAQQILDGKRIDPTGKLYIPANPGETRFAIIGPGNTDSAVSFLEKLDIVFPVLHGPYGEDGTIQGLLEMAGIPYVGAGVAASSVGMDKILMKNLFVAHGIPTPGFMHFLRKHWRSDRNKIISRIADEIGFPCFVKPSNTGSSVGITKVKAMSELERAVESSVEYDRKIIVEKSIDALEIECSVLGNDEPEASVPGEVIPSREFYDYNAKYVDDASELVIPADLHEDTAMRVRELAVMAFKAIDCAGMARVDFLLERHTGKIYVNELNTIPGFTNISMYPKLWEASGISYPELVNRIIDLAFERFEDKSRCKIDYEHNESR